MIEEIINLTTNNNVGTETMEEEMCVGDYKGHVEDIIGRIYYTYNLIRHCAIEQFIIFLGVANFARRLYILEVLYFILLKI